MDGIVIGYGNYREYKAELDRELNRAAEGFVKIGYLLKVARDTDILKEAGYRSLTEFAQAEYSLDASQVSRFIAINDKYSEGGYGETLLDQYQGFGYAKLSLMLTMPEAVVNLISPSYSKSEIQDIKNEVDAEKEVSDLEILAENKEIDQSQITELGKAVYQIGRENPEIYEKLYEAAGQQDHEKRIHEVLAPSGENVITVRIQGTGRVMIAVKEAGNPVKIVKVRSNETEEYNWEEFLNEIMRWVDRSAGTARESWEHTYREEWPIEEKQKIAPVQQKEEKKEEGKKKPEKKFIKAKPNPPKKRPEKVEKFTTIEKEKPKKNEEEKELPMGQLNLVRDFPEYLPEDKRLTGHDANGNWCLKKVTWEDLMPGKVITDAVYEGIYGALWKLMEYEDTGYTPQEIMEKHIR